MSGRFPTSLLALAFVACASAGEPDSPGRDGGAGLPDLRMDMRPGPKTDAGVVCPTACTGRTPVCDPATRKCVACLGDGDCRLDGGMAACRAHQCLADCAAQAGCDAGVCDVDAGVCVACVVDTDCKDPSLPVCDRAALRCAACTPQNDRCAAGSYCAMQGGAYACAPGCREDAECQSTGPFTSRCCDHVCADTVADAMNCGACGTTCPVGSACCGAQCVDTTVNLYNCGACNAVCAPRFAYPSCIGGFCSIASCQNDRGDCDGNPANGCEVDLDDDSDDCGRCGNSCVFVCLSGSCIPF